LSAGIHDVKCLLPQSCDKNNSSFRYTVVSTSVDLGNVPQKNFMDKVVLGTNLSTVSDSNRKVTSRKISYDIMCNGYSL